MRRPQDGGIKQFEGLIYKKEGSISVWNAVTEVSRDLNMCRDIDIFQEREKQMSRGSLDQHGSSPCQMTNTTHAHQLSILQPSA